MPMAYTESVTVLVMVATGSRYESKEINGISHFLEHMMFKGTTKRPDKMDISHELDSIGAEYNAFTSKEYTGYYVKCAAIKIDTALDVISDIFQNSKFDGKEMDIERGPIKEEINMFADQPAQHISEIYESLLYGNQPLGWDIGGEKKIIDAIKREDMVKYFSDHYFDKNTIVAIAGKIDPASAKEKVSRYFDNVRDNKRNEPPMVSEKQDAPALKIEHKKTDQSHINLGFRAYGRFDPKLEALELTAVILGGGMSSRLFVEIREKRGLAYRIRTSTAIYNETGHFTTYAGLNNENLTKALLIILAEHRKLIEEKVPDKELKRVKDRISGNRAISLETSDELASFYCEQELLEHKIRTPEERLAKILAVTADEIQAVARDIFKPEKLNLALIGPLEGDNSEIKKIIDSW